LGPEHVDRRKDTRPQLKQAKTLWRSLEKACYFYMDTYTPGVAPLKAVYLKGPIPE